jgi:hypothetical protein
MITYDKFYSFFPNNKTFRQEFVQYLVRKYQTEVVKNLSQECKWQNILKDEIIESSGLETKQIYSENLRKYSFMMIERFFKQLKYHLKI